MKSSTGSSSGQPLSHSHTSQRGEKGIGLQRKASGDIHLVLVSPQVIQLRLTDQPSLVLGFSQSYPDPPSQPPLVLL